MFFRIIAIIVFIAVTGNICEAGVVSYSYSPYASYHQVPAASAAITYSSQVPVYQQALFQPQRSLFLSTAPKAVSIGAAPVYARSLLASAPIVVNGPSVSTPLVNTVVAAAPATVPVLKQFQYESAPRYDFSYGVHDAVTGDIKSQVETRDGGNVAGSYSLVDADGYKRTVTYTADDLNGFNAVVQREPIVANLATVAAHPVVPVVAPVQQHLQYLPQLAVEQPQPQPQQEYVPQLSQESEVVEAPQQSHVQEPIPVEYPAQQQTPVLQPQFPQHPNYPPYPQYEVPSAQPDNSPTQSGSDDSDVVEARSVNGNAAQTYSSAPATIGSVAPAKTNPKEASASVQ